MNFLFFNLPAHGHVNPSLPVVSELVGRGHAVTYFCSEAFRARVEATGARFETLEAVPDDYFESRNQNGSTPWEVARILQETSAALMPDLLALVDSHKPDAILYDAMCPWGYFTAQAAHLPGIASYSLIPLSPQKLPDWRTLRIAKSTIFGGIFKGVKANQIAASTAKQYGFKPPGMIHLLNMPGDLCIVYSSADFVPQGHAFGPEFRFVGWTLHEPASTVAFEHTSGRPLVYASLGTLINDNKPFFQAAIDAIAGSEYDLLVSTGGRYEAAEFGALPPNVTVSAWVPQTQVLRQASLFITHGGVNSIYDGLASDLPLLLVPQQAEQTINGFAVLDQGAGLMLKREEVNADSLRKDVRRLLGEISFKQNAQRVGKSLRAGGGAVAGVDAIEELLLARK